MTRRRFAPLKEGASNPEALPPVLGIAFDMDGTLCEPQTYMFAEMRKALGGIPKSTDILEHIYSLPTEEARVAAMESIRAIERSAMAAQVAQPGLGALMAYLDRRGVQKAICTRNFEQPVTHLLTKFLAETSFHPVITRDFRPAKPDPAGILHIARSWGLTKQPSSPAANGITTSHAGGDVQHLLHSAHEHTLEADASCVIMVGDSIDDITAGRRAGAATVLLKNEVNAHLVDHEHTDMVITRLDELIDILEEGFEGRHVPA